MKRLEMGRSMVEMLGVLAIVGVLSIGGIVGYDYAVAKFRANTIMSELNLRAIPISQLLTQHHKEANTILTLEAGDTLSSGQSISANVAVNPEYFEFHLTEVDDTTCELVLENYETSAWMIVNGSLYENSTNICSDPDNDMTFVYKNDLGERRNCSRKGFFNLETYKCDCAGGTYFSKDSKDCTCPAGHIWSDAERKCIESRCQEGEFESLDGGCVSCEDLGVYTINKDDSNAIALCEACPNRTYSSARDLCVPDNVCVEGKEILTPDGRCVSCPKRVFDYINNKTSRSIELCQKCQNTRTSYSNVLCLINDACNANEIFGYTFGNSPQCHSCDITEEIQIGTDKILLDADKNACLACNRTIVQRGSAFFCTKTACGNSEFKGINNQCYDCKTPQSIEISQDDTTCIATTCGRKITQKNGKYYCEISSCPTTGDIKYTLLSDGSCYPCNYVSNFVSTQEECDVCGEERGFITNYNNSDKYCKLQTCVLGESFPYAAGGNLCYKCNIAGYNGDGAATCGPSEYAKTYCEACGNYWTPRGNCYMPNSCNKGSEFRAIVKNYKFCTSCDYTEKVEIEDHDKHRDMCTSCITSPRFFADNYCYRCDSNEAPVVSTAEERASCTKCPNRMINGDNQCVLIQTEEG